MNMLNEYVSILIKISLNFVPNNIFHIGLGNGLAEAVMVSLLMHTVYA